VTSILSIARSLRTRDDGVALPVVFGLALVMLMFLAGAMTVSTRGIIKTNSDEDFTAALAAAYAGVEEYQSRLANDSNYQKFGNPSAPFSSTSSTTLSLPSGANANPAFGIGTTGTWANIPDEPKTDGTPVQSPGWFRYEVSNKDYQDKGILHLRVTGRVGDVTRSIVADLKQDGFIDYLYFTNFEATDPAYAANNAAGFNNCERFAYAGQVNGVSVPARNDSDCGTIQFAAADIFKGPVRSNDQLYICGTTYKMGVMAATPVGTPTWENACTGTNPHFDGGNPVAVKEIGMPPTNSDMKKEVRNDLPADVPRPGCLYTGPTVIKFETVGTATKMRVISPWTKFTNVTGSTSATATNPAGATNPAQCGLPGTADGQLGGKDGALIDPLERNLIFVQNVPAVGAHDANAPAGALPLGTRFTCTPATTYTVTSSGTITVSVPAGWQFAGAAATYKYPKGTSAADYESVPYTGKWVAAAYKHYDCRAGDVYIEGTMSGQMTVAADNFVYVTGDLKYKDKATDVLGLVGNNAVFVYNPVHLTGWSKTGTISWPNTTWPLTSTTRVPNAWTALGSTGDREIDAAILSVGHTFQVQNYPYGNRGNLIIYGALAQRFRGTVGVPGSPIMGYTKLYEYDTRFRNIAPPKFLTPTSTTYGVTQIATVPAAFLASGATAP
jgi:hypothetical protein